MNFAHSPKRYRYCGYIGPDGNPAVVMSQAIGCHDKTGVEVYEFDVLAVPYVWLDGILLAPVMWCSETAGFDLSKASSILLDAPKPDVLQFEILPLMASWGYVVGTTFEPWSVIEARARGLFQIPAAS